MKGKTILLTGLLLLSGGTFVFSSQQGEGAPESEELKVLKDELASLRAEVEALKKEVEKLKQALPMKQVPPDEIPTRPKGHRREFNGMDYYVMPLKREEPAGDNKRISQP